VADLIVLGQASCRYLDLGSDAVAVAFRPFQSQFDPMVTGRTVVHPYFGGRAESRHHEVEPAVMVEIGDGRSTMTARRQCGEARLRSQPGPFPVAQVSKYRVRLVDHRTDCHVGRLHMTARNKKILPSVVVEVADVGAVSRHGIAQR
jgi:hypothetical protein